MNEWQFAGYGRPLSGYCEMPAKMVDTWNPERWYWARCGSARASRCGPCSEVKRADVAAIGRSGWVDRPSDRAYFCTLTPPGADRLPWDTAYCKHGPAMKCSGKIGCRADSHHVARWHDTIALRWSHLMTALRRELGCSVDFFKTYELQTRGALHLHMMIRVDGPVTEQRFRAALKLVASRYGFGSQVDVQMVDLSDTGNVARAAGYCAKYATKCADDLQGVNRLDASSGVISPVGLRSWSASRRWGDTMKMCHERRRTWAAAAAGGAAASHVVGAAGAVGPLDPYQNNYAQSPGLGLPLPVSPASQLV